MRKCFFWLLNSSVLFACSNTGNKPQYNIPAPPKNFMVESNVVSPQINKNTPHSLQNLKSQNPRYQPFSKIQEIRGNGGSVSEIRINNRGDIPNYYIYPNQQPDLNINNQQRNISTPTWQLNW